MGRGLFSVVGVALLFAGCGGGGGGDDADPLALLPGSGFGPTVDGSLRLVLDGAGGITQDLEDGVDTSGLSFGSPIPSVLSPFFGVPAPLRSCQPDTHFLAGP